MNLRVLGQHLEKIRGSFTILADVFHAFLTIAARSVSNRQLDILRVSTSLNNWQILFHNWPEIYPRAPVLYLTTIARF